MAIRFSSKKSEFAAFLLVLVISAFMMNRLRTSFRPYELTKTINKYTQEELNMIPEQRKVEVSFYLRSFHEFDMLDGHFIIDAFITFEFDHTAISLEDIGKFTVGRGTILNVFDREITKGDKKTQARYSVRLELRNPLSFLSFPIDDHVIDIRIFNERLSAKDTLFISDVTRFVISPGTDFKDWDASAKKVEMGYVTFAFDDNDSTKKVTRPQALFSIDLNRRSFSKIFTMLLPLFIITLIGLFSLTIPHENNVGVIVGLSQGSFSSLIFHRLSIDKGVPEVAYFTYLSNFYTAFLLILFLLTIIQLGLFSLHSPAFSSARIDRIRIFLYWLNMVFLAIYTFIVLY